MAISCLTTLNLLWFVDLTFQVPMQYFLYSIGLFLPTPDTSKQRSFPLWLSLLIPSGVISPLFSSNILGTYWPEKFIFHCHIFLPFHTVYGVLMVRMLKFAIPFSSAPHFVRTLHKPSVLSGPTRPGSQFHWVRQGCDPCDQFDLFSLTVVFILSSPLMDEDKRLVEASWKKGLAVGKTGSCSALVGRAMLGNSLIQFSADGWGCVPSL